MSKKKERSINIYIQGIPYEVYARFKWQQFLRGFSVALLILIVLVIVLVVTGRMPSELPLSVILVLVLVVLALLAVYRTSIRQQHRRSGLGSLELLYTFDRDGWTVRSGSEQVRVLWGRTWRVRRNDRALLLYPNRKSVNMVPLQNVQSDQLAQILAWCTGETEKK